MSPNVKIYIYKKRFYMIGVVLHPICPYCGRTKIIDFGHHYLSYPTANTINEYSTRCENCEKKFKLHIDLKMEVKLIGTSGCEDEDVSD